MKSHFLLSCLALVLLFGGRSAAAGVVVFSGADNGVDSNNPRPNSTAAAASFDAAAGSLGTTTTINFESSPLGDANNLTIAPGVTTSATAASIVNAPVNTPEQLFGYNTTSGGKNFLSINGGNVTFNFTNPIQALGFYVSGIQLAGETITFFDGSSQTINVPTISSGIAFVGFTDIGASITSVTYNGLTDIYGIDDLRFTTADADGAVVPEAGSFAIWALLGIAGVTSMIWRGARRKALLAV